MRSGAFRNPIDIQRKVQVGVDALNTPVTVWQSWRTPLCEVEVRRGREHFDAMTGQRYAEQVWRFRTRYDEIVGLDAAMRIVFENQNFDIKAQFPDAQHHGDGIIECTLQDAVIGATTLAIAITGSIPAGAESVVYGGFTVSASGGTAPYVFSVSSGPLPAGLTLNASTGVVAGTPTTAGTYPVTFKVVDAAISLEKLPSISIVVTV